MITQYDILRRPLLSEKSNLLKDAQRKVLVEVLLSANKKQIKFAAQTLFGVQVEAVNTSICRGKGKRVGKSLGRRSNWKKAVLTLSRDSDLEAFGVWRPVIASEAQQTA